MWPPKNWPLEPLVLDELLNPTISSPSPQASSRVNRCTDLIIAPKAFYSYITLLKMGGPNRKRVVHENTNTGSSGDQSTSGKESSTKRSDTRSAPQSLPRYDGNRDSGSSATPVGAITTADLRRLEMSFGMWAAYRGVSDLSVLVLHLLLPTTSRHTKSFVFFLLRASSWLRLACIACLHRPTFRLALGASLMTFFITQSSY